MRSTIILIWTLYVLLPPAIAGDITVTHVQHIHHSDSLDAWCVSPNVRVFQQDKLPRSSVTPSVKLRAARGEKEPMQLVIRSSTNMKGLTVRFTGLRGPAGMLGGNCLKSNPIGFLEVAQTSTRRTLGKGRYPDALLKSETFDVAADQNAIVWITATVPETAKPGEYSGRATVLHDGKEVVRLTLTLEVWDFVLPREMPIVIQGNFWRNRSWIRRYTDRDLGEVTKEYFRNMAEHRCDACPSIWPFPAFREGESIEDKAEELREFEDMAKFVLDDLGFKRFRFPHASAAGGTGTGAWQGLPVMRLPAEPGDIWISALRTKKRFLASQYPGAKWFGAWGLRLMVGTTPEPEKFNGSWLEYEFAAPETGTYRCWLEGRHYCPVEVFVDGTRLGVVPAGGEGFKQFEEAVTLEKGKHRLRLVVQKARRGTALYLRRIFLSCRADADPAKLFERRGADPQFLRAYEHHLHTAGQYLAKRGWLEKAHVKIGDEPQTQAYPLVCDVARAVRRVLPQAKTEVTIYPQPQFYGLIDIWVPYATHYKEAVARERQAEGEEVWLYYNELHGIDCPALCMRAVPWLLWRYDFDGYHFWSVNYWPMDPWTTAVTHTCNCFDRGTLIYPDPKDGSPVDSTRWELFREGLEDYLYLHLCQKLVKRWAKAGGLREQIRAETERNLELWPKVIVQNMNRWCEDGSRVALARANLGRLLHMATSAERGGRDDDIRAGLAELARSREQLSRQAFEEEVWRAGKEFDRSLVAGTAELKWGRHPTGASIVTRTSNAKTNPYNGSWVEYDFMTQPGKYRIWIRLVQHQESERKDVYIDGELIGSIQSEPKGKAYTEFKPVPGVVELSQGQHTLRIVCSGIVGWIDSIQWVYLTRDMSVDPRESERSHGPTSTPRRPRSWPKIGVGNPG